MRKLLFTLALLGLLSGVQAQEQLSGFQKAVNIGDATGSRTISINYDNWTPLPSQTGSKVLTLNEGFIDSAALIAAGWNIQNLSSPLGTTRWYQGVNTVFNAYEGNPSEYFSANYNNTTGTGTISDWLITPVLSIKNGDQLSFWTRTVDAPSFPDRLQVRLSTNGSSTNVGATATSVGDFTTLLVDINQTYTTSGYPSVWTQYTITITGIAGTISGRFAFRYFVENAGPSGANSDYIGIDLVQFNSLVPGTHDISITAQNMEYTIYPINQLSPLVFDGDVTNGGASDVTNVLMTATVNDGITDIWTGSSPIIPTMLVGANQNMVTSTAWTPIVGNFTVEHEVSMTEVDINTADNSSIIGFEISDSVLARDNGLADDGTLGIGDGIGGGIGSLFDVFANDELTSVSFYLGSVGINPAIGMHLNVIVYDFDGLTPTTLLYTSPTYVTTDSIAGWRTVKFPTPLNMVAGTYFIGLLELDSTLTLARSIENYTPNTSWFYFTSVPWTSTDAFNPIYNGNYLLRPNFGETITGISSNNDKDISVFPNPTDGRLYINNAVDGRMVVTDLMGNQILTGMVNSDHYELDLGALSSGMYFVKVNSQVYKVIVK